MPCSTHTHNAWPLSGTHHLRIEACETKCGWCSYETKAANNLRAHARRHTQNSDNASLSGIKITLLKAGRSRVILQCQATSAQQHIDELEAKLRDAEAKTHTLERDNGRLKDALQSAEEENKMLRAASSSATTSVRSAPRSEDLGGEDSPPTLTLEQAISFRRQSSPSSSSDGQSSDKDGEVDNISTPGCAPPTSRAHSPDVASTCTMSTRQVRSREGSLDQYSPQELSLIDDDNLSFRDFLNAT